MFKYYLLSWWFCVLYFYRERPKFQLKEDGGTQALTGPSGTVKVKRDSKVEDTIRARLVLSFDFWYQFLFTYWQLTDGAYVHSSQGKTLKSAGWDFSIGGSSSTGTVRSAVKPQARERKAEVSLSRASSKEH